MATGRLGASNLSATTNTTVYTCPADTYAVVSLSVCNRNASPITLRAAAALLDTPTDGEYIEYDVSLPANGVLERTGIVLSGGQRLVIRSSSASVTAVVFGIETQTT